MLRFTTPANATAASAGGPVSLSMTALKPYVYTKTALRPTVFSVRFVQSEIKNLKS
jgi:hypothetical protein